MAPAMTVMVCFNSHQEHQWLHQATALPQKVLVLPAPWTPFACCDFSRGRPRVAHQAPTAETASHASP